MFLFGRSLRLLCSKPVMDRDKWRIQKIEDPHIAIILYCRETNKRSQCKLLIFMLIAYYFKYENLFSKLAMS